MHHIMIMRAVLEEHEVPLRNPPETVIFSLCRRRRWKNRISAGNSSHTHLLGTQKWRSSPESQLRGSHALSVAEKHSVINSLLGTVV